VRAYLFVGCAALASGCAVGPRFYKPDPPADAGQCDLAMAPLFQQKTLPIEVLFPRLLAGIEHPLLAVQVLDLANHVTRRGLAPAGARPA